MLRYLPRRGYMLDCALTATPLPTTVSEPVLRADRPSIAVLPFRTLGERTSAYVAAGLVEEISIALSRFRWLFVLANASAVVIAAQRAGADMTDSLVTGRNFGIRYLVDGSLDETEGAIVVRCRLVETATGRQVWQERFTSEAGGILRLYEGNHILDRGCYRTATASSGSRARPARRHGPRRIRLLSARAAGLLFANAPWQQ